MMLFHKTAMSKQRGFSLIEALVAFLVLSIGMLGIASLQIISLKAGDTATRRTVAVIKVEEILERIRINNSAVVSYAADVAYMGVGHGCNSTAALCTSVQIAEKDIFDWKEGLRTTLANGTELQIDPGLLSDLTTASIAVVPATPGVMPTAEVTVTINWQERNSDTQTMDAMNYSVTSHICTTC